MRRYLSLGAALLFWWVAALAQEVAVPLDSTGKVFVIDAGLERKLGLFTEYSGFLEARLYRSPAGEYFLEIQRQQDTLITRTRIPQTAEEIRLLRDRVGLVIHQRAPEARYNHEGRGGLLVNSTILSLTYYGWAVPVATKMKGSGAGASYFFVSAAGVIIPYFATARTDITRAMAMMDFYGGSRGIAHGIAFYRGLDPEQDSGTAPIGWGTVFSIGERVAFGQWARATKMSDGKASVIGVGGDFGLAMSIFSTAGHDLWDRDHEPVAGLSVLGGSALGIFAGSQLADHGDYSRGDGYVLRAVGILGAGIPAAIADIAEQDGATAADLATAGSVVGLGLGHYLLRDKDFSRSQGVAVIVSEIAGAALATAVVVASDANETGPYSLAAAVGGTGGFLVAYATASKSARVLRKAESLDLNLEFNPLPLLTEVPRTSDPDRDHHSKQAFTLTYRF